MPPSPSMPDQPEPPADDPAQQRLPPLLRRAWYSLNQAFRRRIAHLCLTPDQFTVLRWLHEHEGHGVTQRGLTDLMASDPNTVTSVLSRMEQAGLIERRPDATDRRAKRVRIRPRGQQVFTEARRIAHDLQNEVLAELSETEREHFLNTLKSVADAARDAADRNAPDSRS